VIPTLRLGGVRISIHPALPVLVALALYLRLGPEVAIFAAVLLGHELAHLLAAAAFDLHVSALELLPFGGVARIEGLELADPGVEAAVAVAGPLHNLLCLAGGFLLREAGWLAPGRGAFFLAANAALALGNLLPALPFDGGRAARAALSVRLGTPAAAHWLRGAGLAVGGTLLAAAVALALRGLLAPGLVLFGGFALARAGAEQEAVRMRPWREMAGRAAGLRLLPIQCVAAGPGQPLRELVLSFRPRHYHLIWVVAGGGSASGPWDEAEVWRALRERGADARAGELGRGV